jgi:hypothetical protein
MNKNAIYDDDELSVYNEKEVEYLDRYLPKVEQFMEVSNA